MCRNIKVLFNFDPPASEVEIQASALQFVRKLSGCTKPSRLNEEAFDRAVQQVAAAATELFGNLVTSSAPKNREDEAAKARARNAKRFGRS